VLKNMSATIDWLYGEGENSTFEEYTKRYKDFMVVLEPTKKRSIFAQEVEDRFAMF